MKTALITGASTGIGATFAEVLAKRGYALILVARSRDKLDALAARLSAETGCKAVVIATDLVLPNSGAALAQKVASLQLNVDLLVNNAGFGSAGAFARQSPERDAQMIALNCATVVDLAHAFLPAMLERGSGGILNVASVGAFQPLPYMTIYGATKAFVLSFTEGLWAEMRGTGVKVSALCPGPVDTPFFGSKRSQVRILSPRPIPKTHLPASFLIGRFRLIAQRFDSRAHGINSDVIGAGRYKLRRSGASPVLYQADVSDGDIEFRSQCCCGSSFFQRHFHVVHKSPSAGFAAIL